MTRDEACAQLGIALYERDEAREERNAARAEVERLREALKTIRAREPGYVGCDAGCQEIAGAALDASCAPARERCLTCGGSGYVATGMLSEESCPSCGGRSDGR